MGMIAVVDSMWMDMIDMEAAMKGMKVGWCLWVTTRARLQF